MRAFISIDPPKEVLHSFLEVQKKLDKYRNLIRFTKPENIHMTMRFLGRDIDESSIDLLLSSMQKELADVESFNVRIREVMLGFPKSKWPRILFISMMRNESLDKLYRKINTCVDNSGVDGINKYRLVGNPTSHITIGRVRGRIDKRQAEAIRARISDLELWEGFRVHEVLLYKSILKPEGPIYKKLGVIPLN